MIKKWNVWRIRNHFLIITILIGLYSLAIAGGIIGLIVKWFTINPASILLIVFPMFGIDKILRNQFFAKAK